MTVASSVWAYLTPLRSARRNPFAVSSFLSSQERFADVARVGDFAACFADGRNDITLARSLIFGGRRLEHRAVIGGTRFKRARHQVEGDVEIQVDLAVRESVFAQDVLEGHGGDARPFSRRGSPFP